MKSRRLLVEPQLSASLLVYPKSKRASASISARLDVLRVWESRPQWAYDNVLAMSVSMGLLYFDPVVASWRCMHTASAGMHVDKCWVPSTATQDLNKFRQQLNTFGLLLCTGWRMTQVLLAGEA